MSEFGLCQVRPSTLRFTHDSVSCKFSDGLALEETFRQLLYDELAVGDIQCLEAMYYNGKWLVVRGNRRLYLYKKLEKIGKFTTIEVKKLRFEQNLFSRQFTSENMGVSIRIRGFPNIEHVLNQITNDWRNSARFSRRLRQRSNSLSRSGNTNAVAGYSTQNTTTYTDSYSSGGNGNLGNRQTYMSPTVNPNQNYSWASQQNFNQPYTANTTPAINSNYPRRSRSPTYTSLHGNNSLERSRTSGRNHEYLPSRSSCSNTITPTVTQNRGLTSRLTPLQSVNHNNSSRSQRNNNQSRSPYTLLARSELPQTTDKDLGCCIIL